MTMESINAHCKICGTGYHICMACKSNKLTPWKNHTDTSQHYVIYQILHGYSAKVFTKAEAKERLLNTDLSELESFLPDVRRRINEILEEEKADIVQENAENTLTEEEVEEAKPVVKKSRKRKSDNSEKVEQ